MCPIPGPTFWATVYPTPRERRGKEGQQRGMQAPAPTTHRLPAKAGCFSSPQCAQPLLQDGGEAGGKGMRPEGSPPNMVAVPPSHERRPAVSSDALMSSTAPPWGTVQTHRLTNLGISPTSLQPHTLPGLSEQERPCSPTLIPPPLAAPLILLWAQTREAGRNRMQQEERSTLNPTIWGAPCLNPYSPPCSPREAAAARGPRG